MTREAQQEPKILKLNSDENEDVENTDRLTDCNLGCNSLTTTVTRRKFHPLKKFKCSKKSHSKQQQTKNK